ncbi:uncharacterized protein LOC144627927 isoform X2 [Oculina patagonica]
MSGVKEVLEIFKASFKVYDSELCMLALPPDEQQLLTRVSQYLFCRGIIPVVVRSPTEALIHSRHSRFAIIILPDSDPTLIRKVRSIDGMNCGTPVIVISSADILPESTLHMLGTNEIQEVIHRTSNTEKLERDLITAISHVIGQSCHTSDQPGVQMLPFPVQTPWSTAPHYTTAPMPPLQQPNSTGLPPTEAPKHPSPTQMQGMNMMNALNSSQINGHAHEVGLPQLQGGLVQQVDGVKLLVSDPVTQVGSQGSAALKTFPPMGLNAQENPEAVLPGIETLLTAIQVVEGAPSTNNEAVTFTKFTALNTPDSAEARPCSRPKRRRVCRRSSTESPRSAKTTISDTELESLNGDTKSPMAASLAGGKPYFLSLDSYREAMADDPNANPVDRHNSKERHRRIRITKAAEFFKAVIPGMDPSMDKATAFHLTVHYMVFLRNALRQKDPTIIPKLHETFKEEWGEVFSMEDPPDSD